MRKSRAEFMRLNVVFDKDCARLLNIELYDEKQVGEHMQDNSRPEAV